jgi:hypothetical protein
MKYLRLFGDSMFNIIENKVSPTSTPTINCDEGESVINFGLASAVDRVAK